MKCWLCTRIQSTWRIPYTFISCCMTIGLRSGRQWVLQMNAGEQLVGNNYASRQSTRLPNLAHDDSSGLEAQTLNYF